MDAFFDNDSGAFSGNPADSINGDYSHQNLVDLGVYLNLMGDDAKLRRHFYQNLATGRMIIYKYSLRDAHVSNAMRDGSVIATY